MMKESVKLTAIVRGWETNFEGPWKGAANNHPTAWERGSVEQELREARKTTPTRLYRT